MPSLATPATPRKPSSAASRKPVAMPYGQTELFRRLRGGDEQAREELIARGMNMVHFVARRYRDRGFSQEELVQVGSVGLINAVDRFDLDRGVRFPTFAVPHISGEIRRSFRDHGWSVRVARRVQESIAVVNRVTDRLAVDLQRRPTLAEIADAAQLREEDVLEALDARRQYRAQSLDEPVSDGDGDGASHLDSLGAVDPGYAQAEARVVVFDAMRHLQPRERRILLLRFSEDLKQQEIADRLGLSQMQVSRLLAQSFDRLAAVIEGRAVEELQAVPA